MPVVTMAIFFLSASLITAASMMEPPVWIMALTPALAAMVTVSGLGKNASDIKTLPRAARPCPTDSMDRGIHTAGLAAADPYGLCAFDQDNGIAFNMLDQFPAKDHGLQL